MMWWIIAILIITLTLSILKDTHVKMYDCFGKVKLKQEYDVTIPVWIALIIVILGLLPRINIFLFTIFIMYYAIHAGWNPEHCIGYTHVFSLKGENTITRCLLVIKNLLYRKI